MKATDQQAREPLIEADERHLVPRRSAVYPASEIEERVESHEQRWSRIALCTDPADRPQAERAIALMYRAAKLERPRIVWCGSPLSLGLTRSLVLSLRFDVGESVWEAIRTCHASYINTLTRQPSEIVGMIRQIVPGEIAAFVDRISASIGSGRGPTPSRRIVAHPADGIPAGVMTSVTGSISSSIGDCVSPELEEQVSASLQNGFYDIRASIAQSFCGQHDASWFVASDYVREVRRSGVVPTPSYWPEMVARSEGYAGLEMLARSAGWVLPHRDVCWVSERHSVLRLDPAGRLHCENGPAVAYPDTWSFYYWHGLSVPGEWIEARDSIDPALAFTHPNLERRRALVEIVGWAKVLARMPTHVIDRHADPMIGTLLECDLPDAPGSRFLKVRCGTGRDFVLCVPRGVRTALQANSWTYGLNAAEYRLEART